MEFWLRIQKIDKKMQSLQISAKSQKRHEVGSRYERSQSIDGTKTFQNVRGLFDIFQINYSNIFI
jgi:hypothetical protein